MYAWTGLSRELNWCWSPRDRTSGEVMTIPDRGARTKRLRRLWRFVRTARLPPKSKAADVCGPRASRVYTTISGRCAWLVCPSLTIFTCCMSHCIYTNLQIGIYYLMPIACLIARSPLSPYVKICADMSFNSIIEKWSIEPST